VRLVHGIRVSRFFQVGVAISAANFEMLLWNSWFEIPHEEVAIAAGECLQFPLT